MKSALWVSFDLGVQADYEGMYAWLDEHQAKDCGESLAFVDYEYIGSLLDALRADIEKSVQITKRTRIYVIFRDQDTKKMKGSFIFGGRKAPPWSGYGATVEVADVDET
jgi:hypothetical protein